MNETRYAKKLRNLTRIVQKIKEFNIYAKKAIIMQKKPSNYAKKINRRNLFNNGRKGWFFSVV